MPNNYDTTTKFKVDISELKKAMQDAKRQVSLANSEFKAVSSSMDDWSKSTDGIKAKLTQLDSNLKSQKTILSSLERQYELTVEQMGEGSAEADRLKIAINNQQAVVNKTENEIRKYESALTEVGKAEKIASKTGQDVADVLNDMRKEAEDAEGGFTVLKGAVASFVGDALTKLVDGLKEGVKSLMSFSDEADRALNSFQASTGATAKDMAEFEDAMVNIYNGNYGESFDDIAESMATVKQVMGTIDGGRLENVTTKALVLRDTFGFEVAESMRAVNSLMDQFGLTADEAFNLIAQGAHNGLNQNDDLLDTVNEYSVQFKTAGYSANDMFNMLLNGTKSGTWSVDKLGDAVKEMNIRFSDGTVADALSENSKALGLSKKEVQSLQDEFNKGGDSAQKSVGKMIDSIMSVKDETERYQIGVSVFGTMWEDLGADTIKSLMSTQGEISKTKDTLSEIDSIKYNTVGEALSGIGRNLQTSLLMPMGDKLLPIVSDLATKFSEWLNNPETQEAITTLSEKFTEFVDTSLTTVKDFVEWFLENKDLVIAGLAGIATGFLAFKVVGLIQGVQKAMEGMTLAQYALNLAMSLNPIGIIIALIAGLVASFIVLWNKSDEFRAFWMNLWENVKTIISTAFDAIGKFFTETLPAFIDTAIQFFKELPTKIWTWLVNTIAKVVTWKNDMVTKAQEIGLDFINKVIEFIKQLPEKVWTWFTNVVTKVTQWKNDLGAKAREAGQELLDKLIEKVQEIPDKMLSIGADIVKGLWNGINDTVGWLKDKISGFVGDVTDWLKEFFGIGSPSKLMADEIGKWLPAGIAVGIDDNAKTALNSMKNLAIDTVGATRAGLQTATSSLGVNGVSGGVVNNFTQVINSPKQLNRLEIYRQSKNLLGYAGGGR